MKTIARSVTALALVAGLTAAHAAELTLTGWAFGSGNQVQSHGPSGDFNGLAGGFSGRLSGTDGLDSDSIVAFSVEMEESFNFSPDAMAGYTVVDGASYFARRRGDASIAMNLSRLMNVASSSRTYNSAGSTALQLAIWELVYDTDNSLTTAGGTFQDSSQYQTQANTLLYGINSVRASIYDVFVLEMAGSQDFMVIRPRGLGVAQPTAVPEPGSLALAMVALGGIGLAGRRRRAA